MESQARFNRVYTLAPPTVELEPINMTRQVEQMWLREVTPRIR